MREDQWNIPEGSPPAQEQSLHKDQWSIPERTSPAQVWSLPEDQQDTPEGSPPAHRQLPSPEDQQDTVLEKQEPMGTESLKQELLRGSRPASVDVRPFASCEDSEALTLAEDRSWGEVCGLSKEAQLECMGLSTANHQADAAGQLAGVGLPVLHPGYGADWSIPQGSPATATSPSGPLGTAQFSLSIPALEEQWLGVQDNREELQTCLLKEQLSKSSFGRPQDISSIELVPAEHTAFSAPVSLCDLGGRDLYSGRSGSSSACYALATDLSGVLDTVEASEADGNSFLWNLKEVFYSRWTDRTSSNCSFASSELVGTASPSLAGSDVDVSTLHGHRAEVLDDRELLLLAGTYFNLGEGQQFCETHLSLNQAEPSDTSECEDESGRESPGCVLPRLGSSPIDVCPLEEPKPSIQVTSTPVRGDSSATSGATSLQREIQEGTYLGSCCHRDGSLLSMSWGVFLESRASSSQGLRLSTLVVLVEMVYSRI